jgi:hypothetical protein
MNCSTSPNWYPPSTWIVVESKIYFDIVCMIIAHILVISGLLSFIIAKFCAPSKREFNRLKVRTTILVWVASFAAVVVTYGGVFRVIIGGDQFPCTARVFLTVLVVPSIACTIVLRLCVFLLMTTFSQNARLFHQLRRDSTGGETNSSNNNNNDCTSDFCFHQLHTLRTRLYLQLIVVCKTLSLTPMNHMTLEEVELQQQLLKFMFGPFGALSIFCIFLIPFLAVAIALVHADPIYLAGCTGCKLAPNETNTIFGMAPIVILPGLFFGFKVRNLPDPWGIRREIMYTIMAAIVTIIFFVLEITAESPPTNTYDHKGLATIAIAILAFVQSGLQVMLALYYDEGKGTKRIKPVVVLAAASNQLSSHIDNELPNSSSVLGSSHHVNNVVLLKGRFRDLSAIISDASLSQQFENHLVGEFGLESFLFLQAVEAFKITFFDLPDKSRVARAQRIYRTFIDNSGLYAVNVAHKSREHAKNNISLPNPEMFDLAVMEVAEMLENGAVKRFMQG